MRLPDFTGPSLQCGNQTAHCLSSLSHSTLGRNTLNINLRQATMEFRTCCHEGVNWITLSGPCGAVSVCCFWSSGDASYSDCVPIEALRWITIVESIFTCFWAGQLLFSWIINLNFLSMWIFHIKYKSIRVWSFSSTRLATAFSRWHFQRINQPQSQRKLWLNTFTFKFSWVVEIVKSRHNLL